MAIGLFDTTAADVMRERLTEALKHLRRVRELLDDTERAITQEIEGGKGRAVDVQWVCMILNEVQGLHNEVARANGASLVRVDPDKVFDRDRS